MDVTAIRTSQDTRITAIYKQDGRDIAKVTTPTNFAVGKWQIGVAVLEATNTASAVVIAYTDIEEPTTQSDTDYMTGGLWVRQFSADPSSGSNHEFGAFWDGHDPFTQTNLAGLTGTATYEGDAIGVYAEKVGTAANPTISLFDADVTLTAQFGTNSGRGTISGSIYNFREEGTLPVEGNPRLTLGQAAIEAKPGGFFKGDTSMTFGGARFSGKWGGEFFGNGASLTDHPSSVGGTFGGATSNNPGGYDAAFVGTFAGYR